MYVCHALAFGTRKRVLAVVRVLSATQLNSTRLQRLQRCAAASGIATAALEKPTTAGIVPHIWVFMQQQHYNPRKS